MPEKTTPYPMVKTRKRHPCVFCEGWIEKGEMCASGIVFPRDNPDLDAPWRWHGHPLCDAFYREILWPAVGHDWEGGYWDEDKAEYGWDEWLAKREAATA